jgi:hypothetical protein
MSDKLGDMLLQSGLISKEQLSSALEYQRAIGGKLGVILTKLHFIKEDRLAEFLSQQQKVPVVHLRDRRIDPALMKLIPRETAEKHEILPLVREGDTLTVVTPDPTDYPIIDELAFMTGLKIQTVLATRSEVSKALQNFYYGGGADKDRGQPGPAATPAAREAPAAAPLRGSAAPPGGAAAQKRGRAGGPLPTPLPTHAVQRPLEERPIAIDPSKLARALAGLLVEKKLITLAELMERVGREG